MPEAFKITETAWCPGCGDMAILESLRDVLNGLELEPHRVLVVGGIGQAAKTPQYLNANGFCGLHGRALPPAAAAKMVNPALTVIVTSGDGDTYGEGGNHFIHNIRRNVDMAHFVHDNQIYGLTKGQASPTTAMGQVTHVQPLGSPNAPMNPLLVALAMGAGFVARGFTGDKELLRTLMREAIQFRGYALVEAEGKHPEFEIELKYFDGEPVIAEIARVSKPGRRVYSSIKDLKPIRNGLGISILSTPKGVMSDASARDQNVGGEVLCRVY